MKKTIQAVLRRIGALRKSLASEEGFSLLELLIVIVIITILGTISAPRLIDAINRAKVGTAKQQILNFKMALDRYRLDSDTYPSSEEGLEAIKQYLQSNEVPRDPWGNSYIYRFPGENNRDYDIMSKGPDKQEGTADDINSWELHRTESKSEKAE